MPDSDLHVLCSPGGDESLTADRSIRILLGDRDCRSASIVIEEVPDTTTARDREEAKRSLAGPTSQRTQHPYRVVAGPPVGLGHDASPLAFEDRIVASWLRLGAKISLSEVKRPRQLYLDHRLHIVAGQPR